MSNSEQSVELLARGVCIRADRLLVCRTGNAPIVYLPGGHIEFGECARTALAREIQEELGCPAQPGRFLGGIQHTFIQKQCRHWEINLIFLMEVRDLTSDAPPVAAEKHLSFAWIPLDRLADAKLEPAPLCLQLPLWLTDNPGERWIEPGEAY